LFVRWCCVWAELQFINGRTHNDIPYDADAHCGAAKTVADAEDRRKVADDPGDADGNPACVA
jgi:hypothetical protein